MLIAIATPLLTYLVHSGVACVLAIAFGKVLHHPRDRDQLWKAAVILPLLTTIVAMVSTSRLRVDLGYLARATGLVPLPARKIIVRVLERGEADRAVVREMVDPVANFLSLAVLVVAAGVVVVAIVRLVHRRRLLAQMLSDRCAVATVGTIRVSVAHDLPSPVALRGPEICVPATVANDFPRQHRDALIAHEVAHVERRDPFWFGLVEAVAALSAFQPLVFRVASSFRNDAELICDEAAVRRTNDPEGLIGALALLAAPFDPGSRFQCVPAAHNGSSLVARAARIVSLGASRGSTRQRALFAVIAIVLALGALPVVSAAPDLRRMPAAFGSGPQTRSIRVRHPGPGVPSPSAGYTLDSHARSKRAPATER